MKPVASDPLPLLRENGPIGLVLAAPVLQADGAQPGRIRDLLLRTRTLDAGQ